MNFFSEVQLDSLQAEAIARGLYAIAHVDGMHTREEALVAAFWSDTGGSAQALSDLARHEPPSGEELGAVLYTPELRRLFIKTGLLLALADGQVSQGERALLSQYAEALGLADELPRLEAGVKEYLLSHLSHLQNVEAVAQVARKLEL
ncbi:MAG: hypothetical protein RMK29_03580 [Myxococcales bacterium]|nr:TerB family tellurite resistance protein [Myxococcota bacterium]MDW8280767.1 hypothetical protein [Myxococcales bacterium]